jgi:hypothetical protein
MGLVNDAIGVTKSGTYLGATLVITVVVFLWLRGSGLPIIGRTGTNGMADVFGGN